jgi:hypothetical protein
MSFKGKVPPKNSRQWVKNEKLINQNPHLRAARDASEGFKPTGTNNGWTPSAAYKANYDAIFKKDKQ